MQGRKGLNLKNECLEDMEKALALVLVLVLVLVLAFRFNAQMLNAMR